MDKIFENAKVYFESTSVESIITMYEKFEGLKSKNTSFKEVNENSKYPVYLKLLNGVSTVE